MLYSLYELNRSLVAPLSFAAELGAQIFAHPLSPFAYLPASRRVSAGWDLLSRLTRRYPRPDFGLAETLIAGARVGVRERVIIDKPFCRLLHFQRADAGFDQPKVMIVAPLSGHFPTLLRDTVRAFLPEHEVFLTDWVDAREVRLEHGDFDFAQYVAYIREFMAILGGDAHAISVCQPTVPVLAAVALASADGGIVPKTLTMIGGPIDTRRSPTAVNDFAARHSIGWFERHVITRVPPGYPGFYRRVYPGFLQHAGFIAINPGRHVNSHLDYFRQLVRGDGESVEAHRAFYDEYNAVMDLPAEYYLDTIRMVFKEHALANGKMRVQGRLVEPAAISVPALLTIEGEFDDISGHGQTAAAHDLLSNLSPARKHHLMVEGVGHYGIFSGRKFRERVYPSIRSFIQQFR